MLLHQQTACGESVALVEPAQFLCGGKVQMMVSMLHNGANDVSQFSPCILSDHFSFRSSFLPSSTPLLLQFLKGSTLSPSRKPCRAPTNVSKFISMPRSTHLTSLNPS